MGFSKPTVQLDWINDDSATKYTIPSGPDQLAGHISDTAADPKIFNWCWWRVSQWVEFLDNTFDSNGNEVNAPKSTTITETVAPVASTVTLDAGGIKSWDGSSNAIFRVTESGVVTLGYSGNNIINLTAGVLSVATATAADLVKLHAITPSAADINPLLGAAGNGLVAADITKLADIGASAAEIDQLDGVTVGGSSAGDILTTDDTQTLTNKTLTSPKINEDVVLTATSTELNAAVAGSTANAIIGDATPGRVLRVLTLLLDDGSVNDVEASTTSQWNGHAVAVEDLTAGIIGTRFAFLSDNGAPHYKIRIREEGFKSDIADVMFITTISCKINRNLSGTAISVTSNTVADDLELRFYNAASGAAVDLTTLVNTGSIELDIAYLTDA